ncbi:hypothetical protein [Streptomyces sp. AgN23]|uniref:hypothetical protein n=1 Tax=Streptomyces sp. AgN23 TaxID=1188315 RepID=UPI001424B19B|nr:hypothetical protein [Streptomyces sp. AgN23]AJZ86913.1 hypothetical protein AS97_18285 [Streptomyces sp. AgN23]
MVRQLPVRAFAELEYDLANGRIDPATAEESWRVLGQDLILPPGEQCPGTGHGHLGPGGHCARVTSAVREPANQRTSEPI